MPLAHPAADVWTLLADVADATPDAPAFIHGERRLSFAELLDCAARAAQGPQPISASGRAIAWRCGCPTSRPIRSSISPARGLAPSPSRSTRAIAPSRSPTSSAARAPRCWPARRPSAASTSCRSWPASRPTRSTGFPPSSPSARRPSRCRPPSSIEGACPSTACCRARRFAGNHASARAPCNIFTTSGTTSSPKFVLHRQGAIAGHAQQVARTFGFTAPETLSLAILPMCGVFGFNQTLATLAAGEPSVLVESYEIEEIARLITQHKPTTMFGSDDMYAAPARSDAGPLAVPFDQVGGLCRLQRLAGRPARARAAARPAAGRPLRHERSPGALCAPAARPARSQAQAGRRRAGLAARPCARARSGDRRAFGSRPARRAGNGRAVADGGLLRQRAGDRGGDDGGRLCPHRRPRPARRPRRLHLPQPHGRRAAALRLPGQSAGDRDAHPEGAGHLGLPDRGRAAARGRARRRLRHARARRGARRSGDHRPLQARARQLQGADAHLPDRRLPQDALAQRLQDPAHQAARDGGGSTGLIAERAQDPCRSQAHEPTLRSATRRAACSRSRPPAPASRAWPRRCRGGRGRPGRSRSRR